MSQRDIARLQKKWEKEDRDVVDEAVRALLQHRAGRKYLWWLLTVGQVGTQPFAANALQTSFACGELNVGNKILDHIISVDPAGYVAMMTENANERRDRDTELDAARTGNTSGEPEPGDAAD